MDQKTTLTRTLPTDFSPDHWQAMREMAKAFHDAKALPAHWNSAEKIIMGLQAGAEMGIPPMQALSTLLIVNGKITMEGKAMLKKLRQAGVGVEWVESTDKTCKVKLTRPDDKSAHTEEFTWEDAERAKLTTKDNWVKYPKDMLRWKALSRAARFHCPDISEGLYITEEAMDFEGSKARWTEAGVVVDVQDSDIEAIIKRIEDASTKEEYDALRPDIDNAGGKKGITAADRLAIREACKAKLEQLEGIKKGIIDVPAVETPADADIAAGAERDSTIAALKNQPEGAPFDNTEDAPKAPAPEPEKEKFAVTGAELNRFMIQLGKTKNPDELRTYWQDMIAPAPLTPQQRESLRIVVKQRLEGIKQEQKLASTKVSNDEVKAIIG